MTKTRPIYWVVLLVVIAFALFRHTVWKPVSYQNHHHVYDYAGFLPQQDLPKFDWYMDLIMQESDIDIRFVFIKGTKGEPIEELAVDLVEKLQIGSKTGKERGLLLLYDTLSKRLKVEVGYGLEEFFPDSFVGYLVNRHTKLLFESGDNSLGLRLLLRMLQYRIREAVLGETFDPRVLKKFPNIGDLSGGAGATATIHTANSQNKVAKPQLSDAERMQFSAQGSPEQTYNLYLEWLCQPTFDPNVDLFTEGTRQYLNSIPFSPAYLDFILMGEYGQSYKIFERDNLAMLYFTTSPFLSPHMFVKENGKWRMDILAEVQNTKEVTGGIYNWTYMGKDDQYTKAFSNILIYIQGYVRFKDGDNRALVIRGSKNL